MDATRRDERYPRTAGSVACEEQQADTVNTIRALRAIGVPAAKIMVLINKVETDDDLRTDFANVFGFCASGEATIPEGGVIFANELFAMLKTQQLSIGALNDDATDYRQRLRVAANEEEQDAAIQMIAMKRLAKTCNKNLDAAFAAMFPETLQASLLGLAWLRSAPFESVRFGSAQPRRRRAATLPQAARPSAISSQVDGSGTTGTATAAWLTFDRSTCQNVPF